MDRRDDKLRIVLGASIQHPAGPMIETALSRLLQKHFGMTDAQLRFSRTVLRNYGNMSSPTVIFVVDEVARNGDPRPGDLGMMVALGPGMAAETALLKW